MKTHSLNQARNLLRNCKSNGVAWSLGMGYLWFRTQLLPALDQLRISNVLTDKTLCYHVLLLVGDLYDLVGAPKTSMEYYKRAIELCGPDWETLCELGDLSFSMGKVREANKYYKKAISINPSNKAFHTNPIIHNTKKPLISIYQRGDPIWEAIEHIAHFKADRALQLLSDLDSIQSRRCRAMAHGASGNSEAVLDEWRIIATEHGILNLTFGDWFYLPEPVWNNFEFWSILLENSFRISNFGLTYNALLEALANPPRSSAASIRSIHRQAKKYREICRFHIYRIKRNELGLKRLLCKYPQWNEVEIVLDWLGKEDGSLTCLSPRVKGFILTNELT